MGIIINGQNDTIGPVDNSMSLLGTVSIGGTMTIEDFTNVDAIGIVTARAGVKIPDSQKIFLGTGDDFQIYHNGTDTHLRRPSGSSSFYISADHTVRITNAAQSQDKAKFVSGGAVELYHNGNKKFETTGYGVTVTGIMSATQYYGDGSKLTGVAAAGGGALDITSCLFI